MAMTVLAQYLITRMVTGRDSRHVTIVCSLKEAHPFIKAYWAFADVVLQANEQQIEQADFVFEFNTPCSYRMGKATKQSISDSYAIQLGVGLLRVKPPVLVEDTPVMHGLVLLAHRNVMDGVPLEWPHQNAFCQILAKRDIPYFCLEANASWDEIRKAVGRASLVVGTKGTPTLIAASANKVVLELYPPQEYAEWFKKSTRRTYRMIYGKLEDMTSDFV